MFSKNTFRFIFILLFLAILVNVYYLYSKPVTLTFYAHSDKDGFISELIERYEMENPKINIHLVELPDNTNQKYEIILSTLALKDGSIDIIDSDVTWPAIFHASDLIAPIDDYIGQEELDAFYASALDSNAFDGRLYGLPYRLDTGLLYYRSDLLDAENLEVPSTWEDLLWTMEYMKKNDQPYQYAGSWYPFEGLTCNVLEFIWATGAEVYQDDRYTMTSQDVIKGIDFMTQLHLNGFTHPEVQSFTSGELREAFVKGELLFMRDWPTGYKVIEKNEERAFPLSAVGISPLPSFEGEGRGHGTLGGWQYLVAKHSSHKSEAVDFIRYLTSEAVQRESALRYHYLPSLQHLYHDPDVRATLPIADIADELFEQAKARPTAHDYDLFSYAVQEEITRALREEINIYEATQSIEERMR